MKVETDTRACVHAQPPVLRATHAARGGDGRGRSGRGSLGDCRCWRNGRRRGKRWRRCRCWCKSRRRCWSCRWSRCRFSREKNRLCERHIHDAAIAGVVIASVHRRARRHRATRVGEKRLHDNLVTDAKTRRRWRSCYGIIVRGCRKRRRNRRSKKRCALHATTELENLTQQPSIVSIRTNERPLEMA